MLICQVMLGVLLISNPTYSYNLGKKCVAQQEDPCRFMSSETDCHTHAATSDITGYPGRVRDVKLTAGNNSLNVSWKMPQDESHSHLRGFVLKFSRLAKQGEWFSCHQFIFKNITLFNADLQETFYYANQTPGSYRVDILPYPYREKDTQVYQSRLAYRFSDSTTAVHWAPEIVYIDNTACIRNQPSVIVTFQTAPVEFKITNYAVELQRKHDDWVGIGKLVTGGGQVYETVSFSDNIPINVPLRFIIKPRSTRDCSRKCMSHQGCRPCRLTHNSRNEFNVTGSQCGPISSEVNTQDSSKTSSEVKHESNKKEVTIGVVGAVVVALIAAFAAVYIWHKKKCKNSTPPTPIPLPLEELQVMIDYIYLHYSFDNKDHANVVIRFVEFLETYRDVSIIWDQKLSERSAIFANRNMWMEQSVAKCRAIVHIISEGTRSNIFAIPNTESKTLISVNTDYRLKTSDSTESCLILDRDLDAVVGLLNLTNKSSSRTEYARWCLMDEIQRCKARRMRIDDRDWVSVGVSYISGDYNDPGYKHPLNINEDGVSVFSGGQTLAQFDV